MRTKKLLRIRNIPEASRDADGLASGAFNLSSSQSGTIAQLWTRIAAQGSTEPTWRFAAADFSRPPNGSELSSAALPHH
jgi:hypothetical protein